MQRQAQPALSYIPEDIPGGAEATKSDTLNVYGASYPARRASSETLSTIRSSAASMGSSPYLRNTSINTLAFLSDDDGNSFLDFSNDGASTMGAATPRSSTFSLARTVTRSSISSMLSLDSVASKFVGRKPKLMNGVGMPLKQFCDLIELHPSLSDAEILSVDCYTERTSLGVLHRFLLFHLRRPRRSDVWLRIDRRRDVNTSLMRTAIAGGKTAANDQAQISDLKEHLLRDPSRTPENSLVFTSPPNLGIFRFFLLIFCEELLEYHVWPENCWFLCSLLQEHLGETGAGIYESGSIVHPELANDIRKRIHERVYHNADTMANSRIRNYCPSQCRYRYRSGSSAFPETFLADPDAARGRYSLGQGCFVGSATLVGTDGRRSVHPCLVKRWHDPCCLVPYERGVIEHNGRYTILRITDDMRWVSASDGILPEGWVPVEGGYDERGRRLYHAADVGLQFSGTTAPHLQGAHFVFWNLTSRFYTEYKILCWIFPPNEVVSSALPYPLRQSQRNKAAGSEKQTPEQNISESSHS